MIFLALPLKSPTVGLICPSAIFTIPVYAEGWRASIAAEASVVYCRAEAAETWAEWYQPGLEARHCLRALPECRLPTRPAGAARDGRAHYCCRCWSPADSATARAAPASVPVWRRSQRQWATRQL